MTDKDSALQQIQAMPEDVTIDEILYHLYVRKQIEQGLADVDAGRTYTTDEVKQRLAKWLV